MDDDPDRPFCFEVYSESNAVVKGCKTDSRGTVVQGNHKSYRMSATSAEERDGWVQSIRESIRDHPFHDIVTAKKAALIRKQRQQQQQQQHQTHHHHQHQQQQQGTPKTPKKQHSSVLEMLLTPKSGRASATKDTPNKKKPSESAPDLSRVKAATPKSESNSTSPIVVVREREVV